MTNPTPQLNSIVSDVKKILNRIPHDVKKKGGFYIDHYWKPPKKLRCCILDNYMVQYIPKQSMDDWRIQMIEQKKEILSEMY